MSRKRIRLIIMSVVAIGVAYLGYSLFIHSGDDFLTVSEFKSQVTPLADQSVRVGGKIATGSINWDNREQVIRFVLADDKERLNITYKGVVPDDFKPGADLVVEGRYLSDNTLEASSFGTPRYICTVCH
ncbi:MAG: cytochrome c maturation protein CcmE [Chloroflexi bacterium]|nr:cytochrome c maturation protein CcmE [Chloroflexota bacterium]